MKRILLFIIPLLIFLGSCSTMKERIVEIPVETIRKEYIYNTRVDSFYTRDSVDRWRTGDTVFIYKESIRYKYLSTVDTVLKVDTVTNVVKVETIKEVKVNHIKWYQNLLMWSGGLAILLLSGYILYKI